jgi:hypothetical protein
LRRAMMSSRGSSCRNATCSAIPPIVRSLRPNPSFVPRGR